MDVVKGGVQEAAAAIQNLLNPTETQKPEGTPTETPETESVVEEVSAENNEPVEAEAPAPEPEQQTYTVKVGGEEVSVTLDELRKGYSRTEYFHRKLSELDLQKKEIEAEINEVRQERAHLAQLLPQLQAEIKEEKEPDWAQLLATDELEYLKQEAIWRQKKERKEAILREQARLEHAQRQEQQKLIANRVAREAELLVQHIPEWKDPTVAQKEKADILEYGISLGYSPEEMAQVFDHRVVMLLRKARAFDEAKTKVSTLKPTAPTKSVKPGTIPPPKNTEFEKAKKSFAAQPTVRNAAKAIERLISNR